MQVDLLTIPFLSTSLVSLLYRYERYNGKSGSFGVRGDSIPLGSRILAIADTFDSLTTGQSTQGTVALKLAVKKIIDESGQSFDPNVVNAFLRAWRRKELQVVLNES